MIDWSRVAQLRDEVGEDDFEEVFDLFLEEVGEVIARLRVTPDHNTLERDLHFLKGGALSLGFKTFSTLCQNGEREAANGNADSVDIAEIIAEFENSRIAFQAEAKAHLL
ncbi:Hpt domain-containing protein [Ruegeria sp. 2205SS24-7]|uniref:Hpt domain-containing protein n=1 Tax=Ruegeria discodermiae TaxID=3064389 RepID=UPI00274298F6|nr:Hpt domain-containing protein [Ruegeria sp. 2205SS24-7]MDP5219441.1 Hpt domain-containing protein [Ruegeria sp. 2205SS24-7]